MFIFSQKKVLELGVIILAHQSLVIFKVFTSHIFLVPATLDSTRLFLIMFQE